MNYEKIILDIVTPLVDNKEAVLVRKMPTEKEDDMLYLVVADSSDLGKLIGKNGTTGPERRREESKAFSGPVLLTENDIFGGLSVERP